jgi:hypothetical protein
MGSRDIPKSDRKKKKDKDVAQKLAEKKAERREKQHDLKVLKRKKRRTS